MTLLTFIRLFMRHWKFVLSVPVVMVITVMLLTLNSGNKYLTSTTIYTGFASGYNIVSDENIRVDFNAVNTSFDNLFNLIKARETKEEVSLRLLAKDLSVQETTGKNISLESREHLKKIIPVELFELVVVPGSLEGTYSNLRKFLVETDTNVVYNIINDINEPHYGIPAINEIIVTRLENSDIIRLEYHSDDPAISQSTLSITTEVFMRKYTGLKEGETNNVIAYFENETDQALKRLHTAEELLKNFKTQNRIINYYEQTKFISEKREEIYDDLNKELMKSASAKVILTNIEDKLNNRNQLLQQSEEVLRIRNRLTQLTGELALSESLMNNDLNRVKIIEHKKKIADLKLELENEVDKLYTFNRTKDGIAMKDLLSIWLENIIKLDESQASLTIIKNRKDEIEQTYDFFAPLGSSINKMERTIGVAEKEYLTLLASLSASHMREQNLKVSSQLKVVDPPFYPIKPEASKRNLLITASGLVGFILVIGLLLAIELLDHSIRTPERAAQQTGLVVCGGLPLISSDTDKDQDSIVERLVGQVGSKIELASRGQNTKDPFVVTIISTRSQEGKTWMGEKLFKHLKAIGKNVLYVLPQDADNRISTESPHSDIAYYKPGTGFSLIRNIQAFMPNNIKYNNRELILLQLPALINQEVPIGITDIADMALLVTRSNRLWKEADQRALDTFSNVFNKKPEVVLNGIGWYELESFIGELPKKRSRIREVLKKWAMMNYSKNFNTRLFS